MYFATKLIPLFLRDRDLAIPKFGLIYGYQTLKSYYDCVLFLFFTRAHYTKIDVWAIKLTSK
jgi:hypothetical protein